MANHEIKNIAVFIDVENIYHKHIQLGTIIDKLKEKGRLIVRKAYADWGQFASYKREMLDNSIELIELPCHTSRGKNSADIKLVVDALETVFTKTHIDTFIVLSGDSDYIPLISKLREYDKYVIVVAYDQKSTSSVIKNYCDELIYYSSIAGIKTVDETDLNSAYNLLVRAANAVEKEGIPRRGSQVKQYMKQLDSSFDEAIFGFKQFKLFLKKAEKDKIVKLQNLNDGDVHVDFCEDVEKKANDIESANESFPNTEYLEHLVYWAIKTNQSSAQDRVLLGSIMETLKKFDPGFTVCQYGISKSKGFKALVDQYFVRKGHLVLELNEKNETWVSMLPPFIECHQESSPPERYNEVLVKKILSRSGLNCSVVQLETFTETARSILNQPENPPTTPSALLDVLTEKLVIPESAFNVQTCKRLMNILILTESLSDQAGHPIRDIDMPVYIQELKPTPTILEQFETQITDKVKVHCGEQIDENAIWDGIRNG